MACISGCIGGPGCISHQVRDKADIDKYGMEAREKKILDSTRTTKVF